MYSPRRVYILNSTWIIELHIRELKLSRDVAWTFISWVYATYLFRDLQYHPTSMGWGSRSLRWLIPFSWSLHRIGCPDIRTPILLRARDRIFPLGWWRRWSREPMTAIYLLPLLPRHWSKRLALWLSPKRPPPSLPFHTISRCILKLYHILAQARPSRSSEATLRTILCA